MRLGGDVVAVEDIPVVERNIRGPVGRRPHCNDNLISNEAMLLRIRFHDQSMWIGEASHASECLDPIACELMLEHLDLMAERHPQPDPEVLAFDVLLDPVRQPVEPALAPSREVKY